MGNFYVKTNNNSVYILKIFNQLENLEAAKAAYLWLPLFWLPLATFGYLCLSLPFLTIFCIC